MAAPNAIRISSLPPYVGIQITPGDYILVISPSSTPSGFTTLRATPLQVANYVKAEITNQSLKTTDNVIFNKLVSTTSVSSQSISAINFFGDGSHITNVFDQTLNTFDDVTFASLSSASLSTNSIAAKSVEINGLRAASKFSATINHTGVSTATLYTINHPITAEDITAQLYERRVLAGGNVQLEQVIAAISNFTNGTLNFITVTITNNSSAEYKLVIIG
jgi:hypothetical protein